MQLQMIFSCHSRFVRLSTFLYNPQRQTKPIPARLQKSNLPRYFFLIYGRPFEFSAHQGQRTSKFYIGVHLAERRRGYFFGYAGLLEFAYDRAACILTGTFAHERVRISLVGKPAAPGQIVEQRFKFTFFSCFNETTQALLKVLTREFAPRQHTQRAAPQ